MDNLAVFLLWLLKVSNGFTINFKEKEATRNG